MLRRFAAPALAALIVAPASGQTSQAALRFSGTGTGQQDRVRIALDDDLPTPPTPDASAPCDVGAGSFTIELWLRGTLADNTSASSGGEGSYADNRWISGNMLVDRDVWGGSSRDFGISVAGGRVRFGTGRADVAPADGESTLEGDVNVLDGTWHHVACVRDAASGVKRVVVDGVLDVASAPGTSTDDVSYPDEGVPDGVTPWNRFLVLAAEKHDAGAAFPSFAGWLDEVRVWDVARTTSEIAAARTLVQAPGTPGLVGQWRFEEGAGTSVADTSGAGSPAGELVAGVAGNGAWALASSDPLGVAPIGGPPPTTLAVDAIPSGLTVLVDGVPRTTPWIQATSPGAVHALEAPLAGALSGATHAWRAWGDGPRRPLRVVTVPAAGGAWTARFAPFAGRTLVVPVAASERNADHHPPQGQQPSNAYDAFGLCAGRDGDGAYQTGLEFALALAPGERIVSARLELVPTADQAGLPTLVVRAYDVADAPPFSAGSPLALTAHAPLVRAALPWVPGTFTAGVPVTSPELAPLVQAVVDRADWTPGGHVGLVIDGSPSAGGAWRCVSNLASGTPPLLRVVTGADDAKHLALPEPP